MESWLSGHESEQAPGDGKGQESLACCSPWGRKESDWATEQQCYLLGTLVLCFTSRSIIHFELFCKECKFCVSLSFCMWKSSCSNITCCKDCLFYSLRTLSLYQRSVDCNYMGLFLVLYSVPCSILPIPHCLGYCGFILILDGGWCQFSNYDFLQYCVVYSGCFASSYKLQS